MEEYIETFEELVNKIERIEEAFKEAYAPLYHISHLKDKAETINNMIYDLKREIERVEFYVSYPKFLEHLNLDRKIENFFDEIKKQKGE
jgi:hypothetical protein